MNKRYFKMAAILATAKKDNRQFLIGAVGIRRDQAVVGFSNLIVRMGEDVNSSKKSFPPAHAEARLAKKLDKGSIVYIIRVKKIDNSYANARPCPDCQRVMRSRGVKKVYYTIGSNEYGVMDLNSDFETTHNMRD
jgi:tRNA(Arg) A34 adenosine deaminase TadA